ncbi:MAG: hypothetical protein MJK14_12550 [Rivularia sp. ALOHA_DT_140]|nr:hypothetical protein [Rivularia sp. ALOHA_DT_140]
MSWSQVSNPLIPGIITSSKIKSGLAYSACSIALSPSVDTNISHQESAIAPDRTLRLVGLSSTIKIIGCPESVILILDFMF